MRFKMEVSERHHLSMRKSKKEKKKGGGVQRAEKGILQKQCGKSTTKHIEDL